MSDRLLLEELQRQNRQLRRMLWMISGISVAGSIALVAVLSCAPKAMAPPGEVLKVNRLEVMNGRGEAVVVISADDSGRGKIVTSLANGQQLVQIASTDEGGTVAVCGQQGKIRAAMGVTKRDEGTVFNFDGNGHRLLAFGTAGTGEGALLSFTRNGQVREMWP
ncbi:MAG TPA: hypothetical protein PKM43_14475 [Verrucomicrobiota bacterium]|nr:hypothetical protein [Verrucomicrobiota bacterium]